MAEDTNNLEKDDVTTVNLDTNSEIKPQEENLNNQDLQTEINQLVQKKKTPLIKKILFGLIGFLLVLIIIGIVLYFTGFFHPEEVKVETTPQEQVITPEAPKEDNSYKFDLKDINSKKLNEQLAILTNKNIVQEKNEEKEKFDTEKRLLEEQKLKEEEALKLEEEKIQKEKAALEETKLQLENEKAQLEALKKEAMILKGQITNQDTPVIKETEKIIKETNQDTKKNSEDISPKNETTTEKSTDNLNDSTIENNSFLKFINVAKIKGQLYKKYLDKVVSVNPNVILCRDDKNRIELYFGPFKNESERDNLLNKLLDKGFDQAYKLEFTKEEFDSRCNY